MSQFETIIYQVALFIIFISTGYGVRRAGLVSETGFKDLSTIIVKILMPCMVFKSIVTSAGKRDILDNLYFFGVCAGMLAVLLAAGAIVTRAMRLDREHANLFKVAFAFGNVGGIGLFLVAELFPAVGVLYIALYTFLDTPLLWSYGISLTQKPEAEEKKPRHRSLRKLINPALVSAAMGIAVVFTGLKLPSLFMDAVGSFAAALKPVGLLFVGSMFTASGLKAFLHRPDPYIYVSAKMLLLPLAFFLLLHALGVPDEAAKTVMILSALPSNTASSILSAKNGTDYHYLINLAVVSTVACFATYPLLFFVLQLLHL